MFHPSLQNIILLLGFFALQMLCCIECATHVPVTQVRILTDILSLVSVKMSMKIFFGVWQSRETVFVFYSVVDPQGQPLKSSWKYMPTKQVQYLVLLSNMYKASTKMSWCLCTRRLVCQVIFRSCISSYYAKEPKGVKFGIRGKNSSVILHNKMST